ncbi:hypothetical protein DVA67_029420 [Solirubrobacter sp. CPCC 204708]|nr:hypothetical protein [Solirubrobacter deserti]
MVRGGGPGISGLLVLSICVFWCGGSKAEASSLKASVTDVQAPVASPRTGSLLSASTQLGIETLTFDATDVGVGVFRAVIEARIDRAGEWKDVVSAPVQTGGTCTPLRETDYLYEFDSPQPCPLSVRDREIVLNPGVLPVGSHDLRVTVEDASGNKTALVPAKVYTVPAPPVVKPPPVIDDPIDPGASPTPTPSPSSEDGAPNGTAAPQAGEPAASGTAQLTIVGPSSRTVKGDGATVIQGRLTDAAGQPIVGAVLNVQARAFLPKPRTATGAWKAIGTATTNQNGEYGAKVPGGASRTLLVSYRRLVSDALPAALAQIDVLVPATIAVRPNSTRIRNGRSVVFSGRVAGPIPRGGVLVALEVREPGRWIPVATTKRWVRTKRDGSFRLSYRFRSTFNAATYRFRVVADEDSAFAYARGTSKTIAVRVSP